MGLISRAWTSLAPPGSALAVLALQWWQRRFATCVQACDQSKEWIDTSVGLGACFPDSGNFRQVRMSAGPAGATRSASGILSWQCCSGHDGQLSWPCNAVDCRPALSKGLHLDPIAI